MKLFNYIYDTGIYPESWCKGVIVPIHKKGDKCNPNNYRGITLINVMSKIFSLSLRNRINEWCESTDLFSENQFGFRDERGTIDCIFILHSIIQNMLASKRKLYCAFIDYEKAFDSVIHDALWIKLVNTGISCKAIRMIKSMYQNVKACIKNNNTMNYSDFFEVTLGVKQGEPLSPLMFILFLNDISKSINFNDLTEDDIQYLSLYMLLFADDIALFTTDPNSLQSQLNNIYSYSCRWGLKINVNKTKICVFESRKTHGNNEWFINGEQIELVDNFCYLGINFTYNGLMKQAVKTLNEKALKAYHNLLSVFTRINVDIKLKLSLFDSLIVPIILYGCEIWGPYELEEVDKLHIRFCKLILGVKSQTPNVAVFGELGRVPLSVIAVERSLKFWLKIMKSPGNLINTLYREQCIINNRKHWACIVLSKINHLGLGNLIDNININSNYYPSIKQRIRDQYFQNWHEKVNSYSKLQYYKNFKTNFQFETYLSIISNDNERKEMTRFRLSSHQLQIEQGRYQNIERAYRLCTFCSHNVVESEYHFLLCCPFYRDLRLRYFNNISWPSLSKFYRIMSSTNKKTILNTGHFIYRAVKLRNEKLAHDAAL